MSDTIVLALKCAALPLMVIIFVVFIERGARISNWWESRKRRRRDKKTGRDVDIIVGRARNGGR